MSYCRFENTYRDLVDCVNALARAVQYDERISESEIHYAKRMYEWCEQFVDLMDELQDREEEPEVIEEEEEDEELICPCCDSNNIGISALGDGWKCFDCGSHFKKANVRKL